MEERFWVGWPWALYCSGHYVPGWCSYHHRSQGQTLNSGIPTVHFTKKHVCITQHQTSQKKKYCACSYDIWMWVCSAVRPLDAGCLSYLFWAYAPPKKNKSESLYCCSFGNLFCIIVKNLWRKYKHKIHKRLIEIKLHSWTGRHEIKTYLCKIHSAGKNIGQQTSIMNVTIILYMEVIVNIRNSQGNMQQCSILKIFKQCAHLNIWKNLSSWLWKHSQGPKSVLK